MAVQANISPSHTLLLLLDVLHTPRANTRLPPHPSTRATKPVLPPLDSLVTIPETMLLCHPRTRRPCGQASRHEHLLEETHNPTIRQTTLPMLPTCTLAPQCPRTTNSPYHTARSTSMPVTPLLNPNNQSPPLKPTNTARAQCLSHPTEVKDYRNLLLAHHSLHSSFMPLVSLLSHILNSIPILSKAMLIITRPWIAIALPLRPSITVKLLISQRPPSLIPNRPDPSPLPFPRIKTSP